MGLQGINYITEHWVEALAVAFIVFGVWGALDSLDDETFNQIFLDNNNTFAQTGKDFMLMAITFGATTPAYRYNLPFINGYIVGINDIPYLDLTDLIILVPVWLITMFFLKRINFKQKPIEVILIKILIIVIILIITFLFIKWFQYQLYLNSAVNLGIPRENAIQAREDVLARTEKVSGAIAVIAFLGGLAAIKKLKK